MADITVFPEQIFNRQKETDLISIQTSEVKLIFQSTVNEIFEKYVLKDLIGTLSSILIDAPQGIYNITTVSNNDVVVINYYPVMIKSDGVVNNPVWPIICAPNATENIEQWGYIGRIKCDPKIVGIAGDGYKKTTVISTDYKKTTTGSDRYKKTIVKKSWEWDC